MGGAGVASAGMCGPRLKVDGQHGEATREVCDGYVGRTSGTMRAGGKGDASSLLREGVLEQWYQCQESYSRAVSTNHGERIRHAG
jgi:expansin (peptidoglycan-binding protein)